MIGILPDEKSIAVLSGSRKKQTSRSAARIEHGLADRRHGVCRVRGKRTDCGWIGKTVCVSQSGHQFAERIRREELTRLPARDGALKNVAENVGSRLFHDSYELSEEGSEFVNVASAFLACNVRLDRVQVFVFAAAAGKTADYHREPIIEDSLASGMAPGHIINNFDDFGRFSMEEVILHRRVLSYASSRDCFKSDYIAGMLPPMPRKSKPSPSAEPENELAQAVSRLTAMLGVVGETLESAERHGAPLVARAGDSRLGAALDSSHG